MRIEVPLEAMNILRQVGEQYVSLSLDLARSQRMMFSEVDDCLEGLCQAGLVRERESLFGIKGSMYCITPRGQKFLSRNKVSI